MSTLKVNAIIDAAGGNTATINTYTPPAPVRAWVNFNGTGTVAIRASYNVTSITDNGTGDYTVNFTTAMSDANYSVVAGSSFTANGVRGSVWAEPFAVNSSSARILATTATNIFDCVSVTVAIFR
jgi:hypothetical protein